MKARERMPAVAERDGGWLCFYCEAGLVPVGAESEFCDVDGDCWTARDRGFPTLDHVIAVANGGSTELWNLVLACGKCNSRKGTKPPLEFIEGAA